jgi:hypothetical protein
MPKIAEPIRVGALPRPNGELSTSQAFRVYSTEGKSVNLTAQGGGAGAKTGLYAEPVSTSQMICHTIPQEVTVRKYPCDTDALCDCLREHKAKVKLSNNAIAIALDIPVTKVEHWFRKDRCFAIPDAELWFDLKKLLCIETDQFDDPVTVFETKEGVFEKSERCYGVDGKMSTLMTGGSDNIITGLYAIPYCSMPVREATKKGYTEIEPMDCVDMTQPNSKTRRGRNMADKSNCCMTSCQHYQDCGVLGYATPCEWDEDGNVVKAISVSDGKTYTVYEVKDGQITIKGKQYPIKLIDGYYIIRKLTVRECMRLQTVPEWYEFPVSDSQAYKMLGNGWTVDVIIHLINGIEEKG